MMDVLDVAAVEGDVLDVAVELDAPVEVVDGVAEQDEQFELVDVLDTFVPVL